MFKDAGKELKTLAKIGTVVLTIPSVVLGIAAFVYFVNGLEMPFVGLLVTALIVGLGYFFARLVYILLYAYGELVDKVVSIEAHIVGNKTSKSNKKDRKSENKQDAVDRADAANPSAVKNVDGSWDCPFCEHHNVPNAQWCGGCGIKVDIE